VDRTTVDVGALLDDIAMHLPESWRRPDVELRLEVALGLPRIERDSGKLKTVVRNLVHNPYEFTERGRVTLGARAGVGGAVEITVADTGRGIPPEAIDRVFEMFQQVPGSGGGGVGLGLHIVRRFVDVLGGTVAVSSEVGRGTCFVVTLPRSGAPAAAAHAA
jgi:signal transduction histidine kinase